MRKKEGRKEGREAGVGEGERKRISIPITGNSPLQPHGCKNVIPNSKLQDSPWKNQ